MATNSTISILETSGVVKQIYCHWDGYVEHNGRILKQYYNTPELVKELISHGNLSVLGEEINPSTTEQHTFCNPQENVCIYYGRDGDDAEVSSYREYKEFEDFDWFKIDRHIVEYNYLFVESENKWYLLDNNANKMQFLIEYDKLSIRDILLLSTEEVFNLIKSGEVDLETFQYYIEEIANDAFESGISAIHL